MVASDNFHSRLVGWGKILLPLMALALLSTMFLFARQPDTEGNIPVVELDEMARSQRISAPRFSGVATDGSMIQITADSARPEGENALVIDGPELNMNAADGTSLRILAGTGTLNNLAQTAELTGLARLEASSGYLMETAGLSANLATGQIASHGPLEIQSPFGELIAGQVEISTTAAAEGQQMHFINGVKLIYRPPTGQPSP